VLLFHILCVTFSHLCITFLQLWGPVSFYSVTKVGPKSFAIMFHISVKMLHIGVKLLRINIIPRNKQVMTFSRIKDIPRNKQVMTFSSDIPHFLSISAL
jgi:hypothetical protein